MKYSNIVYNDTANGQGMRISFFVQGCPHHCEGCFNQESWDFNGGIEFAQSVLDEIMYVFGSFKEGYDGITFLGGEPLANLNLVNLIIDEFKSKFPNKTIWIYSGWTYEEIIKDKKKLETLSKCNVLVDGKFMIDKKDITLKFRGSSNQRIINIKESLKQGKVIEFDWKNGEYKKIK